MSKPSSSGTRKAPPASPVAPVAVRSGKVVAHMLGRPSRAGKDSVGGDSTSHNNNNGGGGETGSPLSPPSADSLNNTVHSNPSGVAPSKPSYYRILIDGDEGDHNYVKCADLIYRIIQSRIKYKALDKGEKEMAFDKEGLERYLQEHYSMSPYTVTDEEDDSLFQDVKSFGKYSSPPPTTTETVVEPEKMEENGEAKKELEEVSPLGEPTNEKEKEPTTPPTLQYSSGIYRFKGMETVLPPWKDYLSSVQLLYSAIESGPCLSTGRMRVTALFEKFELYSLLNNDLESVADSYIKGGGVYASCMRVDNGLNRKTAVPAPLFMDIIKRTVIDAPNTPLYLENGSSNDTSESLTTQAQTSSMFNYNQHNNTTSFYPSMTDNGRASTLRGTIVSTVTQSNTAATAAAAAGAGGGGSIAASTNPFPPPILSPKKGHRAFSRVSDSPGEPFQLPTTLSIERTGSEDGSATLPHHSNSRTEKPEGKRIVTISSLLRQGGLTRAHELTMEGLGLHPTLYRNKFIQYDMFNETMNPSGRFGSTFLQAVLSTDGPNKGDLSGALLRYVLERNEFRKGPPVATEVHLDVYGHHPEEIPRLAAWAKRHGFHSLTKNMWSLSIQRRLPYEGAPNTLPVTVETVGDQLRCIFYPLFMATLYPKDEYWGVVAQLLDKTGSIHVRTQAVTRSETFSADVPSPDVVKYRKGCSDYYFFYYVWCNLTTLNALRRKLGLATLNFNPSVQEQAPAFDQLVCGFLLGDVVHHVTSLQKSWIMQFLYLYCQVGIVMTPLRDNVLQTAYFDHPVVTYFKMGMRVSISTGDPLYFHHRLDQPLLEEYATLMKVRSLGPVDLCELARNSVLNSNFPFEWKEEWLGKGFTPIGSLGNDIQKSCLSNYRLQFRHETLSHEETLLNLILSKSAKPGTTAPTMSSIPFAESVYVSDVVQQFRQARRMNYTDQSIVYPRIDVYSATGQTEERRLQTDEVTSLRHVILLRQRYSVLRIGDVNVEDVFTNKTFEESQWEYNNYYGVFLISRVGKTPTWPEFLPRISDFRRDVESARKVVSSLALRRLALHRLSLLERKFLLHVSMNIANEGGVKEEKEWNNRDYYTAHKVDNNIQTEAGPNARTLLEFFVEKALNHGDDVVFEENSQPVTLRQLLSRHRIDTQNITVDELYHQLDTHVDLHTIFLSPYNFMQGRYFAELTKRTLNIYKEDAFSFAEFRLSMSGSSPQEWYDLGHWFDRYGMASPQARWMVRFPRQYRRLRQQGVVRNFGDYLFNIFQPLWEVSLHPASDTKLHYFLTHVSGFDCYDDESKIDLPLTDAYPHDWESDLNPPYNMYLYYMWANIATLNEFRASRGLGTFTFRPQCGENGGMDHLIGGYLLANSISHGVTLSKHPVLEYLFYVTQLGVSMSPLSNTANASAYLENPFPMFFHRGLNVSLSTNKPLYFHFTREPLVEEYSIAAKLWQMEFNDLSEVARNSVLQCGYPPSWKSNALGPLYTLRSTLGNDVQRSRVSDIRVAYRYEVYHTEMNFLDEQFGPGHPLRMPRAMKLLEEELQLYGESVAKRIISPERAARHQRGSVMAAQFFAKGNPSAMEVVKDTTPFSEENAKSFLKMRTSTLQHEIEQLDKELTRMKVLTQQVSGQNSSLAAEVQSYRDRLKEEGLTIFGNLDSRRRTKQGSRIGEGGSEFSSTTTLKMTNTMVGEAPAAVGFRGIPRDGSNAPHHTPAARDPPSVS